MSFLTGQVPSVLKIAKVIPIYKNQSKVDYTNYRPIEKLMHKRLSTFLDINNLVYSLQFGFRRKHLTTHALISPTESIRQTLDDGSFGCDIFVDLQKAFDTVDHEILLHKLEYYGIVVYVMTGLSLTYQIVNNLFLSMVIIWLTTRFCSRTTSFLNLH